MKEEILNSIEEVEHTLKISKRALSETLSCNEMFWKRAVKHQEVLLTALQEQLDRLEEECGEWIIEEVYDQIFYQCSICKESFPIVRGAIKDNNYNYCPNCGAKMKMVDK